MIASDAHGLLNCTSRNRRAWPRSTRVQKTPTPRRGRRRDQRQQSIQRRSSRRRAAPSAISISLDARRHGRRQGQGRHYQRVRRTASNRSATDCRFSIRPQEPGHHAGFGAATRCCQRSRDRSRKLSATSASARIVIPALQEARCTPRARRSRPRPDGLAAGLRPPRHDVAEQVRAIGTAGVGVVGDAMTPRSRSGSQAGPSRSRAARRHVARCAPARPRSGIKSETVIVSGLWRRLLATPVPASQGRAVAACCIAAAMRRRTPARRPAAAARRTGKSATWRADPPPWCRDRLNQPVSPAERIRPAVFGPRAIDLFSRRHGRALSCHPHSSIAVSCQGRQDALVHITAGRAYPPVTDNGMSTM